MQPAFDDSVGVRLKMFLGLFRHSPHLTRQRVAVRAVASGEQTMPLFPVPERRGKPDPVSAYSRKLTAGPMKRGLPAADGNLI